MRGKSVINGIFGGSVRDHGVMGHQRLITQKVYVHERALDLDVYHKNGDVKLHQTSQFHHSRGNVRSVIANVSLRRNSS